MGFFPERKGTRVVLLAAGSAGTIVEVRHEPYLKPYVVSCDDGATRYVSACDLAREDDPDLTPLGGAIER